MMVTPAQGIQFTMQGAMTRADACTSPLSGGLHVSWNSCNQAYVAGTT